jgi:flagellar hook-associated protein 3 FlgL
MTNRISTFGQSSYILSQTLRLQSQYNDAVVSSSSGLKSQTYSGIAPDAQNVLNLQSQHKAITTQTANAQSAQNRLNSISGALTNISSALSSALSNISAALSTPGGTSTSASGTQALLQANLNELVSTLNMQYAGDYLFSGSMTQTAPVDLSASGYTGLTASTANASYYQGNDGTASVQISSGITLTYGLTADNSAFEQALRGLSMAVANPGDTTTLKDAYQLVQQASTGVGNLIAQTGAQAGQVESQITVNTATLTYLDNNISDLTQADLSQVTVQMSNMENQLEASYGALANMLKLNLASYLK